MQATLWKFGNPGRVAYSVHISISMAYVRDNLESLGLLQEMFILTKYQRKEHTALPSLQNFRWLLCLGLGDVYKENCRKKCIAAEQEVVIGGFQVLVCCDFIEVALKFLRFQNKTAYYI